VVSNSIPSCRVDRVAAGVLERRGQVGDVSLASVQPGGVAVNERFETSPKALDIGGGERIHRELDVRKSGARPHRCDGGRNIVRRDPGGLEPVGTPLPLADLRLDCDVTSRRVPSLMPVQQPEVGVFEIGLSRLEIIERVVDRQEDRDLAVVRRNAEVGLEQPDGIGTVLLFVLRVDESELDDPVLVAMPDGDGEIHAWLARVGVGKREPVAGLTIEADVNGFADLLASPHPPLLLRVPALPPFVSPP
jgi:hypothetical protein